VIGLRLYDYGPSPNCLKVRILLRLLGLQFDCVSIDILGGDTLTDSYAQVNPARRTPVLEVKEDRIVESNAIIWFLAESTSFLPSGPLERAQVLRWLLFELDRGEDIAALRFRIGVGTLDPDSEDARKRREAGRRGLDQLELALRSSQFLVGDGCTVADLANYAYVHVAPEAGLPLRPYPAILRWLAEIERQPGFVNDLEPLPENARIGAGLSIYG